MRREAYPVWIYITKEKCRITVPDFSITAELGNETIHTAITKARALIESEAKTIEDDGKVIPAPNSVEYKKLRGEVFAYVDVNLDKLIRSKKLVDLEKIEEDRVHSIWDVKENVIEFMLNQKVMAVTLTQKKYINRIKQYAKDFPDEVRIERENEDGSIFAKIPTRYLRIVRPSAREMTEEEKDVCRERLANARNKRDNNENQIADC